MHKHFANQRKQTSNGNDQLRSMVVVCFLFRPAARDGRRVVPSLALRSARQNIKTNTSFVAWREGGGGGGRSGCPPPQRITKQSNKTAKQCAAARAPTWGRRRQQRRAALAAPHYGAGTNADTREGWREGGMGWSVCVALPFRNGDVSQTLKRKKSLAPRNFWGRNSKGE